MVDEESQWVNVEEQLDKAISEVMFAAKGGTPSLGVLLDIFRTPGSLPAGARERAEAIEALVGESESDADALSHDQKLDLSNLLVDFLRFACRRGAQP